MMGARNPEAMPRCWLLTFPVEGVMPTDINNNFFFEKGTEKKLYFKMVTISVTRQ